MIYRISLLFLSIAAFAQDPIVISDELELIPISEGVYIHESYLQTDEWGKVGCNGLLYISDGEVAIMDTPTSKAGTTDLIKWIKENNLTIKAVIPNHFHADCVEGLAQFHDIGAPSYGYELTSDLAKANGATAPKELFEKSLTLNIGSKTIIATYFGPGHTHDNIAVWMPEEKIIFGGCLVKKMNAGEGNLADANVTIWPSTIEKIKSAYPEAAIVVPGHGKHGGVELLDYTIELFSK
ncbi:MAG: subclass B1 metallo-beta-lactamase [Cyclobacteriaceae bacterium]